MNEIFQVLTQNILPILIVAGAGYLLQRQYDLDKRTLNSLVFNVLSPALIFSSLVGSNLPSTELLEISVFTVLAIVAMGLLAFGVGRALRYSRREMAAFLIVVMFVNSGNYGITLNLLRYGESGQATAVVYYVVSTILLYSVGVLLASLGTMSLRETVARMVRLPAIYAAVLAVIVYVLGISVPGPLMSAIDLAGSGAIPVMLVVLGMQMASLRRGEPNRLLWPAVGLRLLVGPIVALGVAAVLGMQGLSRSTSIIEASMPAAVFTIVLANEFGLPATAVAPIVVVGTLLSPLTVAATIALFGL